MTLLELAQLCRKKWHILVIVPLLCVAVVGAYAWGFMPNKYTSSVSMYVLSKTSDQSTSISSSEMTASQQLANDIAVLTKTDRVTSQVASSLGLSSLSGYSISVSSSTNNRVITLSVTGQDPEMVAKVANKIVDETSKAAVQVMNVEAVNVIDAAKTPTSPSGPNRLLYVLVGFLAGLFVALVIVVLTDVVNNTVRTSEEAEELFGLPVVGRMPVVKRM